MYFLGRVLRHGDANFWKLALFRRGKGRYECRLRKIRTHRWQTWKSTNTSWSKALRRLDNPLIHHNVESLSRYIQKHDEYSNWESRVLLQGERNSSELPPALFGTQAQRRRWLKKKLFAVPGVAGSSFLLPVLFAVRIYGRRSRPDLLRVSGGPDVSHQGQDLRAEDEARRKVAEEMTGMCGISGW
jgi:hypothetical protein